MADLRLVGRHHFETLMCFMVFVSTDSDQDLASLSTDLFVFEKPSEDELRLVRPSVAYPKVWYLASKYGGCSCHYRHLLWQSTNLGFGAPEEWFHEDEEDVESTQAVYDLLASLIETGSKVDIVDFWNGEPPEEIIQVVVNVNEIDRDSFRFMENCRFDLVATKN